MMLWKLLHSSRHRSLLRFLKIASQNPNHCIQTSIKLNVRLTLTFSQKLLAKKSLETPAWHPFFQLTFRRLEVISLQQSHSQRLLRLHYLPSYFRQHFFEPLLTSTTFLWTKIFLLYVDKRSDNYHHIAVSSN